MPDCTPKSLCKFKLVSFLDLAIVMSCLSWSVNFKACRSDGHCFAFHAVLLIQRHLPPTFSLSPLLRRLLLSLLVRVTCFLSNQIPTNHSACRNFRNFHQYVTAQRTRRRIPDGEKKKGKGRQPWLLCQKPSMSKEKEREKCVKTLLRGQSKWMVNCFCFRNGFRYFVNVDQWSVMDDRFSNQFSSEKEKKTKQDIWWGKRVVAFS